MLPLINSYTTSAPAVSFEASVMYELETRQINAGTVVSWQFEPSLNSRIESLLNEYSQLQNDWDEDDALAPNTESLQFAQFVTKLLSMHGQRIFHAAPGPNGEIMLDIRNRTKTQSLEIIFYPDRAISVSFPAIGKPFQQAFTLEQLPSLLSWLNGVNE